jgi:hypothetical protein
MERESDRESVSVREGQAVGLLQEEYVGIVRRGPRERSGVLIQLDVGINAALG